MLFRQIVHTKIRKIAENVENQIGEMTSNDSSAREIAKTMGYMPPNRGSNSQKRNISAFAPIRSRPRSLTARNARGMERLMIAKPKTTPKGVAISTGKPINWFFN